MMSGIDGGQPTGDGGEQRALGGHRGRPARLIGEAGGYELSGAAAR